MPGQAPNRRRFAQHIADVFRVWGTTPVPHLVPHRTPCAASCSTVRRRKVAQANYLSLTTCGTRYDDNFLGEKDNISACLGDSGRTRAASFGRRILFGSASLLSKETARSVERFVFVQGEIDFVGNDIGPLGLARHLWRAFSILRCPPFELKRADEVERRMAADGIVTSRRCNGRLRSRLRSFSGRGCARRVRP